ncbi:hypothetical protein RFI_26554, partial [Reticulomyxa filosa]
KVAMRCIHISKKARRVEFQTHGNGDLRENIGVVFGQSLLHSLVYIEKTNLLNGTLKKKEYCKNGNDQIVTGTGGSNVGIGRNRNDRQFFYINDRPVDVPKIARMINHCYKHNNITRKHKYPVAILNLKMHAKQYDVNLDPNKRAILLSEETQLIQELKQHH